MLARICINICIKTSNYAYISYTIILISILIILIVCSLVLYSSAPLLSHSDLTCPLSVPTWGGRAASLPTLCSPSVAFITAMFPFVYKETTLPGSMHVYCFYNTDTKLNPFNFLLCFVSLKVRFHSICQFYYIINNLLLWHQKLSWLWDQFRVSSMYDAKPLASYIFISLEQTHQNLYSRTSLVFTDPMLSLNQVSHYIIYLDQLAFTTLNLPLLVTLDPRSSRFKSQSPSHSILVSPRQSGCIV